MQEQNNSRLIFFIGAVIILGGVITCMMKNYGEMKVLIDTFFKNKIIKM
ncbi:hypothetical protein [Clostridium sporogenes]|nr:hypothetical protein [Clostridium sporogenes]MBY7065193.1 hypothetical protein [Clostridium sporogenes]MBY7071837.1 hypothetical protein [Clostridium sporogenes]MCW6064737.1 hypothetical protein [Clostridium sporogenes]UCA39397.1 hypothetical protein LA363_19635 [Clostridium sporogenes]